MKWPISYLLKSIVSIKYFESDFLEKSQLWYTSFEETKDLADFLIIDVLLKGSPDLSFDDNVLIMNSVHTFICGTKRLDY